MLTAAVDLPLHRLELRGITEGKDSVLPFPALARHLLEATAVIYPLQYKQP